MNFTELSEFSETVTKSLKWYGYTKDITNLLIDTLSVLVMLNAFSLLHLGRYRLRLTTREQILQLTFRSGNQCYYYQMLECPRYIIPVHWVSSHSFSEFAEFRVSRLGKTQLVRRNAFQTARTGFSLIHKVLHWLAHKEIFFDKTVYASCQCYLWSNSTSDYRHCQQFMITMYWTVLSYQMYQMSNTRLSRGIFTT